MPVSLVELVELALVPRGEPVGAVDGQRLLRPRGTGAATRGGHRGCHHGDSCDAKGVTQLERLHDSFSSLSILQNEIGELGDGVDDVGGSGVEDDGARRGRR